MMVLWKAFVYSLSGIKFLLQERAFVQELILGVFLIVLRCRSNNSSLETLYMFSAYILVLIVESLNTAVETVVNRISMDQHNLSKKAKDIGSATVFISLVHLAVVWMLLIKF